MKLILTRHAKSAWDDPLLSDFERTLNARGRDAARRVGAWLNANGHLPQEVILSGAARTVETWDRTGLLSPNVRTDERLYHAPAELMLTVLQGATAETVMLIGHNPGIADFARRIAAAPVDHPRAEDYPTAATLIVEVDAPSWRDLRFAMGRARAFVVPRDLPEAT